MRAPTQSLVVAQRRAQGMEDRMGVFGGRAVRRGFLVCMAVVAALAAGGCSGSSATPETIYITPTPGSATPLPPGVTPGPTAAPVIPVVHGVVIDTSAPDSRWRVTFKKPVVSGVPEPAGTKINDAITAKVNGYIDAFTGSGLPAVTTGAEPSTLQGDFTIALDSQTLLSLRFTLLTYVAGSAHPAGEPGSINFVVSTGDTINLTDILADPTGAIPTLSTQAHAALATALGSELTWTGPATSLSFFDKAWAMTQAGLEFAWPQGDLASMAAGMPNATLPWSSIKSIVKPDSPAGEFVN
jgi:hypothetical protein